MGLPFPNGGKICSLRDRTQAEQSEQQVGLGAGFRPFARSLGVAFVVYDWPTDSEQ